MLNVGNNSIKDLNLGSKKVSEAYLGDIKVYPNDEIFSCVYYVPDSSISTKIVDNTYYIESIILSDGTSISFPEDPSRPVLLSLSKGYHFINIKVLDNITNISNLFRDCRCLYRINKNFLSPCRDTIKEIAYLFYGCESLVEIPNLFENCNNLTTVYDLCSECTSLTDIDPNLLTNLPKLKECTSTFFNCKSLVGTPVNIFSGCSNLVNINGCFSGCSNIQYAELCVNFEAAPKNLTNISEIFKKCTNLEHINTDMFVPCTKITNFDECFYDCQNLLDMPCTKEDSNALPIYWWEREGREGYPSSISGTGCFHYCIKFNNKYNIPSEWQEA